MALTISAVEGVRLWLALDRADYPFKSSGSESRRTASTTSSGQTPVPEARTISSHRRGSGSPTRNSIVRRSPGPSKSVWRTSHPLGALAVDVIIRFDLVSTKPSLGKKSRVKDEAELTASPSGQPCFSTRNPITVCICFRIDGGSARTSRARPPFIRRHKKRPLFSAIPSVPRLNNFYTDLRRVRLSFHFSKLEERTEERDDG
jgi:hypothetical protein